MILAHAISHFLRQTPRGNLFFTSDNKDRLFKWRRKLCFEELEHIQALCHFYLGKH